MYSGEVSGVLERQHFRETIALAQMRVPSIRTIGIMMHPTPTTDALIEQIKLEIDTYPARVLPLPLIETLKVAEKEVEELHPQCDALIRTNLRGLTDKNIVPMTEEAVSNPRGLILLTAKWQ